MGVKIRNKSRIPKVRRSLRELNTLAVEVGILGTSGSHYTMLARVHEFGVTIRKGGGEIVIPERSFIRSAFDENETKWIKFATKRIIKVINGQMTARDLYELLGTRMVSDIQQKITDLDTPPLAQSTIDAKGSSNPLIDTGGLRMRVTYRVVSV